MTATRNKALDRLRRRAMLRREHAALAADDAARDQASVGDELLRLIFIACHPVLPREAQVALTLRLLGGLETAEIARAFLVPEATVAQRIVRAKKALHGQAFELPAPAEDTDWSAIVAGYDRLLALKPSPVMALIRAVAIGFARGPAVAAAAPVRRAPAARMQSRSTPGSKNCYCRRLKRSRSIRDSPPWSAKCSCNISILPSFANA